MDLSIVIPLLNERDSLKPLTESIESQLGAKELTYEIIFVDDGSTDKSCEELAALQVSRPEQVKWLRFTRNYGKAAALSAGIEKAAGEVIITMDADLQDDPVAIPEFLNKLDEGWEVVSGWKKKRYDPISKTLPSKLFNAVTALMTGVRLHDFNCGFKAYRAPAAKGLEIYGERHRYLPVLAHWNGYSVTEIEVPHHARKFGHSKYGLERFTNGLFDLITLLFLQRYLKQPLHFFGLLGMLLCFAGGGVLTYFGIDWIITGAMRLRPLILLSLGAVIAGIQFISIGLVGEMITNASTKDYFTIKEQHGW